MSNSADLHTNRGLELLENLKQTAAAWAKREEQLTRQLSQRRYAISRESQDGIARVDASLGSETTGTQDYYSGEIERVKAIYDRRLARVQKYSATTLRELPKRAQEAKARWMGTLQMKDFLAQRKLAADQAAADAAHQKLAGTLESHGAALQSLEKEARSAFRGYGSLKGLLRRTGGGDTARLDEVPPLIATAREQLEVFRGFPIPRFFALIPLSILFAVLLVAGAVLAGLLGFKTNGRIIAGGVSGGLFVLLWIIQLTGLGAAKASATAAAGAIVEARGILDAAQATAAESAARRAHDRQASKEEYDRTAAGIQQQWGRSSEIESDYQRNMRRKLETQTPRIIGKIEKLVAPKLKLLASERDSRLQHFTGEAETLRRQFTEKQTAGIENLAASEKTEWQALEEGWKQEITPIYEAIAAMNAESDAKFPAWSGRLAEQWTPPEAFTAATKFGRLDLDLAKQPGGLPRDPRLALPGPAQVSVPVSLTFPDHGSLLFETSHSGDTAETGTLNNIVLRLLSTTPPGKLAFTIIDPVGLGQNFAGLMHLSDYEETLINRRIWTQRDQIEERLAELGEHIEKVIQMYLRNEYETITEYNEKAGSVAEKYHFLVVADFPANFSDVAAKRLQSIAASGPRCGIFTLIQWDKRQQMPDGFAPDELRKNSVCIKRQGNDYVLDSRQTTLGATFVLDRPPGPDLAVELVNKIGRSSIDSNRVEVPFSQIAPAPGEMWTGDTTSELKIAIGRTGATKLQYLAIGKGTRQHALFAGKTGSGKSTLFHVIITNLALTCSPEQVEFYLIDFKKGVEFKCYATRHLPHAKVVAIESDREFALSVLQRVDDELKRRGDMFRKLGVQDVAGYKRAGGTEPMPRVLLLIDEFQEFFVEDDSISQTASLLFDRIVRQGRAFGIHVLLGSQTLGGAYSLARTTLGQMVIRVALQCNEADAYLIMDENNSAPRLLSRPGEGIYNDAAGAVEGNSPFQVVWLPDDERDQWLDKIHGVAEQRGARRYPGPIVFEGNAPADIHDNHLLGDVLEAAPAAMPVAARAWLGAPNSIKGPTEAVFHRQSGNNMLIVGQREEASVTMIGLSMLALAAQYPRGGAKFVLFHGSNPGSSDAKFLEAVAGAIPHEITVAQGQEIGAAMDGLAAELKSRSAAGHVEADAPSIFLFIHGLQKFKKLRHEDDFSFSSDPGDSANPGAQLNEIISEGSSHGLHIVTSIDTLNSVNRFMNRKALSEFEMRVVFQMSANDSASLIDSPKAGNLGLHRAIYYNEHEGSAETFRPYAFPDSEWLREVTAKLAARAGETAISAPVAGVQNHQG